MLLIISLTQQLPKITVVWDPKATAAEQCPDHWRDASSLLPVDSVLLKMQCRRYN
jgi:hypothetical protein